jgi:phosphoglycerate dehydrogenase-like enzyme
VTLAVYLDTVPADRHGGPGLLESAGFDVRDVLANSPADVVAAASDAVALLVGDSPITAEVLAGLAQLRIVATATVGVDHIDLAAARARGVWVANAPDTATEEVAATALAMALALVRHLPFLDRHVRAGGWDAFATGERHRPSTLALGIVGLGRIGSRLANLATPLFGRVLACDPAPASPAPAGVKLVGLADLLEAADVVSLHLPAQPGTAALLDAAGIARMRRGAFLVNAARGSLVDTAALLDALDSGRLSGAALDVVAGEPPPLDARVRRHPRVLLTPHAAFVSSESAADTYAAQARNVIAWRECGRPLTPVLEGRP